MFAITRRELFRRSAHAGALAGFASHSAFDLQANPLGLPIGCQTYPVREMIARDFPGTLKKLSDAGFQTIELCSPVGYADSGFSPVGKYTGPELRKVLADSNLACESCHFDINELRKDLAGRIAWANDVGLKQMIVPSLDGPKNPTLDDVKRAAEEYNKMAAQSAMAGLQQGLHNEDFELSHVDGKRTYDLLLKLLDPKLVKFQFQVSTVSEGYDPVEYFTRYPGRFFSMHVQGWSAKTRQTTAVGKGTLDWRKIFTAAKTGGLQNYFVEMKLDLMKASVPYLRGLRV
jgi:sugar phosphate isomerase/epimerase